MNFTRLVLAAVAATVFDALYGLVVYGMLLAPQFARTRGSTARTRPARRSCR